MKQLLYESCHFAETVGHIRLCRHMVTQALIAKLLMQLETICNMIAAEIMSLED